MNSIIRHLRSAFLRLSETAGFAIWLLSSRLRFGAVRWITVDDHHQMLVRTDDYRAYRIAKLRGTQKANIGLWRKLAELSPDVCVDIGANYGEFSLAIADTGLPVVTIEPNPRLLAPLQATFSRWKNVQVHCAAVADEDGAVSLYVDPQESGSASLSRTPVVSRRLLGRYRIEKYEVPARRLDSLINDTVGMLPASVILKIDVEGFEQAVLQGAMPLLKRASWWRALVEFNPMAIRRAGDDPQRVWSLLREYHGVLVSRDTSLHLDLVVFNMSLPDERPKQECDVLIGEGTVSMHDPFRQAG